MFSFPEVFAEQYMCFVDLDNSGTIDSEQEVASCIYDYKCPVAGYSCDSEGKCSIPKISLIGDLFFEKKLSLISQKTVRIIGRTTLIEGYKKYKQCLDNCERYYSNDPFAQEFLKKCKQECASNHDTSYYQYYNELKNKYGTIGMIIYQVCSIDAEKKNCVLGQIFYIPKKEMVYETETEVKLYMEPKENEGKIQIWPFANDLVFNPPSNDPSLYLTYDFSQQEKVSCVKDWVCPLSEEEQCYDSEQSSNIVSYELNKQDKKDDGERDINGSCLQNVYIFNGQSYECRLSGIDTLFHNCCSVCKEEIKEAIKKGLMYKGTLDAEARKEINLWLLRIVIQFCKPEETYLSCAKELGLCHYIGKYCKKELKIDTPFFKIRKCLQGAKVYCCFNSKLARIVHEKGRPQLKTFNGWGEVRNPNCRGFTPEEFQMLDFSRIDLSEWYEDIKEKAQQLPSNLQKKFEQNLPNIESKFKKYYNF